MKREDTHAPSTFEPGEYEEVGSFDNHHEDGYCDLDETYSDKDGFAGNYERRGRCDHCGAGPLRYGIIFHHGPSDELVVVGLRCAHKLGLSSRTELDIRRQGEAAARRRKVEEFIASLSDDDKAIIEWAHDVNTTPYVAEDGSKPFEAKFPGLWGSTVAFIGDLDSKLHRYGSLSGKQLGALVAIKARVEATAKKRQAEREELESAGPLEEGRREIVGTILSARFQESDFGSTPKMLVKQDDGNKVWLTVPEILFSYTEAEEAEAKAADALNGIEHAYYGRTIDDFKGLRVKLTATVTRSDDDEHFGFGKLPKKAEIVG